jgi:hypothetical protein
MTDLATRYGRQPSKARRSLAVAAVVVLAVVGAGWLAWAAVSHSTPAVRSQLVAFQVRSEHEVTAHVTVVREAEDTAASCRLRAVAEDHAVVGELTVEVDQGGATQTISPSIRTERRATSVELVGCTAPGQSRPR